MDSSSSSGSVNESMEVHFRTQKIRALHGPQQHTKQTTAQTRKSSSHSSHANGFNKILVGGQATTWNGLDETSSYSPFFFGMATVS
mmetsp:Transcript_121794/g.191181  ORF Transcript_121794/g.191181 Transcript_121794/m.191181 type:complete len:86 (-) Transcript_121794:28-285(-)